MANNQDIIIGLAAQPLSVSVTNVNADDPITSYSIDADNAVTVNGVTYTVTKDETTGLINKITDSGGNELIPSAAAGIADVSLHNAVIWAAAVSRGLGVPYIQTLVLYDAGNECTDITGGWTMWHTSSAAATEIKGADYMYLKSAYVSYTQFAFVFCTTANAVDLTLYNKLHFDIRTPATNRSEYCDYGISKEVVNEKWNNLTESGYFGFQDTRTDVVMDISSYTGRYYINTLADLGNELYIYKVWLEK